MSEFTHILQPMFADCNGKAPPSELARLIIGDTVLQMGKDGIPRQRLVEEKGSVWMVDKFRLQQFKHIDSLGELTIKMSQRREKAVRVYYTADAFCLGEHIARAEICFFAAEYASRRILRLKELELMWNTQSLPATNMERAAFKGEMICAINEQIRHSDCDLNRHLSSPKYLDFVCDVTGYWEGAEKLCELMQIDFVSECLPKSEITLLKARSGELEYIRGVHEDGSTAFDAVCKYRETGC